MNERNLLAETLEDLASNGQTPADVRYVTDGTVWQSWEEFANQAANTCYDAGFGEQEINSSLCVVGDGWWLDRYEYDGSEWWEYQRPPRQPATRAPLTLIDHAARD